MSVGRRCPLSVVAGGFTPAYGRPWGIAKFSAKIELGHSQNHIRTEGVKYGRYPPAYEPDGGLSP
jgi:hypothetical protein